MTDSTTDIAAWNTLSSIDPLLVDAAYDLAHERGYDTEPPDRPCLSQRWSVQIFCSHAQFSDLINAAQGRRNAKLYEVPPSFRAPEQLGATP